MLDRLHLSVSARKLPLEFSDEADFMFITRSLEESLTFLRGVEGVADIVLAGRSTTRLNSKHLKIPIISFHPTLSDFVQAILEAQTFDTRIALALSSDDRDFDFSLLSKAMHVSLSSVLITLPVRKLRKPANLRRKKTTRLLLEELLPSKQLRNLV